MPWSCSVCRCIRSNASKQANAFDVELVAKQLSYTGVLETVAIRRQGYSVRLMFQSFLDRFEFVQIRINILTVYRLANQLSIKCKLVLRVPN